MSAAPNALPRESRALRLVNSSPLPIEKAKKYDPLKAKEYICTPMAFYRYLAPYRDENGEIRTKVMGESQIWFLMVVQELLWGDRRPEPGEDGTLRPKAALTWTDPITDEYVGERCGCGAKMARIMIADAVLRGLVLAKPAKSGSWHYNLPVDHWHKVPPYQPAERKPPAKAAAIDAADPQEKKNEGSTDGQIKGEDTPTRFQNPPAKRFVFLPGSKKVVVFEQRFERPVQAERVRIHCSGLSAPVEVESKPQDGVLDVFLRDASPPDQAANGLAAPPLKPLRTISPDDPVAKATHDQMRAWFEDLYTQNVTPIIPDPKTIAGILAKSGSTTFAQYQEKIQEGKARIKAPSMLLHFVEDCARQAAAWKKRGTKQAKWDKPWDEDPVGENVGKWRATGANLKMSYNEWLGVEYRKRRGL